MHSGKKSVYEYFNSFFSENIIETFNSYHNPTLEVTYINGRYQLNAGSVNYSYGPLHDAFRKYFKKDPPELKEDDRILILGLGAGSAASILRYELHLANSITGVEIDPMVIEAGRKYFDIDKIPLLEIVVEDAYDYVQKCHQKYDLIIIDLYIDDKVPDKFQSLDFIFRLSNCLHKGGKVVINKLIPKGQPDQAYTLMNHFQTVFDTMVMFEIYINKNTPNCFITGRLNE